MFDDGYWPAFTSGKARSTHAAWDQVGEGFVKELDFSRIWLRINANDSSNEKDDIVAEFKCDTKDFLEQCFVGLFFYLSFLVSSFLLYYLLDMRWRTWLMIESTCRFLVITGRWK
jgi:hypothetical protein